MGHTWLGLALVSLLPPALAVIDPISIAVGVTAGVALMASVVREALSCGYVSKFEDLFDDEMEASVYGQHLAIASIPPAMRSHLEQIKTGNNPRALALAFYGSTGTGKTFVSTYIELNLLKDSKYKNTYSGARFGDIARVATYRQELFDDITSELSKCPQSLFVFLDAHMFVPGVLDILIPFLDYGADSQGVDATKAMFIFQSNECDREINMELAQFLAEGKSRTELPLSRMASTLNGCLKKSKNPTLIQKLLVRHIPFLPLTKEHLIKCADAELLRLRMHGRELHKWQGLYWSSEVLHYLVSYSEFVGDFAITGCKGIAPKVNAYVEGALTRMNPRNASCSFLGTVKNLAVWEPNAQRRCHKYKDQTLEISMEDDDVCIKVHGQDRCLNQKIFV